MFIRALLLISAWLAMPTFVLAQDEGTRGTYCYTSSSTHIVESMQHKTGGTTYVGSIRMFLLEEVDSTKDGKWVKVNYEDSTGYVLNPQCIEMSQLHAEADPLITENLKRIALNPEDQEAYGNLARASLILGEYDDGIKYIEQAVALEPQNLYYNMLLGLAYRETNRMKELWHYIIPDIGMEKDWYIPGAGSVNVHSVHRVELVDHWMIVNLTTWTYVAVPEGWLVNDDFGVGAMAFEPDDVADSTPHPAVILKISEDAYSGDPKLMLPHFSDKFLQTPGTVVLRDGIIDENSGYVLMHIAASSQATEPSYLLAAYSRNPSTDIDGGYRIYLFLASKETNWKHYYPLIQAMIAHVRNTQFIPVGVDLPDDLGILPVP